MGAEFTEWAHGPTFARLHYTHTNPVKHGVVPSAENYEWCSMAAFLRESNPGFRKTVLSFPIDAINVWDDFLSRKGCVATLKKLWDLGIETASKLAQEKR